jgi:23S rRNA (cytidine1920-2'-O)/16S rRNA (cytidine1409-2'-O)-methyltransferase
MKKQRLDLLLVERGLAETRSLAQRLIMAGEVRVDGQVELKPSSNVLPGSQVTVDRGPRFVSRGGEKLEGALAGFNVPVKGRVCADAGASTGGFTDALLQHGAVKVYAIDVGNGILDWKIRQDPRVVVMEGTNARHVECLPEPISLVTVDVSFISLKIMFPVIRGWYGETGGEAVTLIKPQFEAGKQIVSKGKGVVRDPNVHRQVLEEVLAAAQAHGFQVLGLMRSPLLGPKGNIEFLAYLKFPGQAVNMQEMIGGVLEEAVDELLK